MCNCIEKQEKKLKKETGDDMACIYYHFLGYSVKNPKYIPMRVRHRKKKKDGSLGKVWTDKTIYGDYCPFCGKKIIEEANDG